MTAFLDFLDGGGRTLDLIIVAALLLAALLILAIGTLLERKRDRELAAFYADTSFQGKPRERVGR